MKAYVHIGADDKPGHPPLPHLAHQQRFEARNHGKKHRPQDNAAGGVC
jgi:hypothetical protein